MWFPRLPAVPPAPATVRATVRTFAASSLRGPARRWCLVPVLLVLAGLGIGGCRDEGGPLAPAPGEGVARALGVPPSGCGRLLPNQGLTRNQVVRSCNGKATLALQGDQNVVLYDPTGAAWVAPNTLNRGTADLVMQGDGNLVAYSSLRRPLWASGTPRNPGAWLAVQDDCNLVVYRGPYPQGGRVLWTSNTRCRVPPPLPVAPVAGPFRITKLENLACYHAPLPRWTFCQHQGPSHTGGGVGLADDRYAWDVGLSGNADAGKPVYAAAPGRVVKYGGSVAPGGTYGAVLIEHNTDGRTWWSGYLHLRGISVSLGQSVTSATVIGYVGRTGAKVDHLHFATYTGTNTLRGLRSFDTGFVERR